MGFSKMCVDELWQSWHTCKPHSVFGKFHDDLEDARRSLLWYCNRHTQNEYVHNYVQVISKGFLAGGSQRMQALRRSSGWRSGTKSGREWHEKLVMPRGKKEGKLKQQLQRELRIRRALHFSRRRFHETLEPKPAGTLTNLWSRDDPERDITRG